MAPENQNPSDTPAMKDPATSSTRKVKRGTGKGRREGGRSRSSQLRSMTREAERSTSGLARRGKRMAEDAQHWVEEARGAIPRLAKNMHLPSRPSLETFTEANPVVLGAVGLGIGVLIGALLPRDVFHSGMQGLGLSDATPSRSTRSSGRSRSKR
jgi:hypothetical protein